MFGRMRSVPRVWIAMTIKNYSTQCVVLCLAWSLGFVATSPIVLAEVSTKTEANASEFDCVIEPHQVVKLSSPVVGVIARLDVDRGDIVHQGQILGKLEDGVEAAALELAKAHATNEYISKSMQARLEFLRSKYKRANDLYAKAIGSQAALEEADAAARLPSNN
jgi:multidrug efflux pump subunit AcrA (membrane-fusion protein)